MITLSFLADFLIERYPNLCLHAHGNHILHAVNLFRTGGKPLTDGICYVCNQSVDISVVDSQKSYILVGQDSAFFRGVNRIVIPEAEDASIVFEDVQDIFQSVASWKESLYNAVTEGASIQKLLELSENIFGNNPIIVQNESRQVLGYIQSGGPGKALRYWQSVMDQDFISGIDNEIREAKALHQRLSGKQPAFFENLNIIDPDIRVLHCALTSKDVYMYGHITVAQYQGKLKKCHLELIKFLARQINAVLERDISELSFSGKLGPSFLTEMLINDPNNPMLLKDNLEALGWRIDDTYQILALNLSQEWQNAKNSFRSISFLFSQLFQKACVLLIDKNPVIICSASQSPVLENRILQIFQEHLHMWDTSCGISMEFDDFSLAKEHYQQAKFARERAAGGELCYYEKCMIDDIIGCYTGRYKKSGSMHPDIAKLTQYDRTHDSNLVITLYYYLLCDRSFNRCSELLNIHRSTFRYRLGIIREMIHANLDDPDTRLALLFSARIAMTQFNH